MPFLIVKNGADETKKISFAPGESVLDCLLNAGVDVEYGCKSGACHSCLLQSPDIGLIPCNAQKGLRDIEQSQGYFLSCQCQPNSSLNIRLDGIHQRYSTKLVGLDKIANSVWRLRLNKAMAYRPGQYISLKHESGVTRSYSIASHPVNDDFIECHIRVYPDGKFSQIINNDLKVGDSLEMLGPYGRCVYENKNNKKTLLLAGLGTGLAPLYGVARDALLQGHAGKIIMLIGAKDKNSLYYQAPLKKLTEQYANFHIEYSVLHPSADSLAVLPSADIYKTASDLLPNMTDCEAYLCGSQSFVQRLRKECFLRGANLADIKSDEFLRAVK